MAATLQQAVQLTLDDEAAAERGGVVTFRTNEERVLYALRRAAEGFNYFVGFMDASDRRYGLSYAICPWVREGGVYAKDLGNLVH